MYSRRPVGQKGEQPVNRSRGQIQSQLQPVCSFEKFHLKSNLSFFSPICHFYAFAPHLRSLSHHEDEEVSWKLNYSIIISCFCSKREICKKDSWFPSPLINSSEERFQAGILTNGSFSPGVFCEYQSAFCLLHVWRGCVSPKDKGEPIIWSGIPIISTLEWVPTTGFLSFYQKQCKNCSGVFCDSCVRNELPLPSSILPEIVCNSCFSLLLQQYASTPTWARQKQTEKTGIDL